jgi:hypothetical protein
MNNCTIFLVGIAITLITCMGVLTSQIFIAYKEELKKYNTTIKPKHIQNI